MKSFVFALLTLCLIPFVTFADGNIKVHSIVFENKTSLVNDSIFPEKCLGVWEGMLEIFNKGKFVDSVKIRFTAAKTDTAGTYIWKTEYLSKTRPMVKDYKLVVDSLNEGRYMLDEGGGVELFMYCVNNKLYGMFNVNDICLTSSNELIGDKLIFEVTSGKKVADSKDVKNYSISNVQRAVLVRID